MNPNPINTILLQPTDVLFFRDGRPMEGSLAGHGAAWPLPNVTDAAFHAALHRSGLNGHPHDQRHHTERHGQNNRHFGSLVTAGPFPVRMQGKCPTWFLPRPFDLQDATLAPTLLPTATWDSAHSSLADPLDYAVANRLPPSKDNRAKAWLSDAAFQRYLDGSTSSLSKEEACDDAEFGDAEATVGIALDPETGTTGQGEASGKIYSARHLRLRDEWRLGVFAKTDEKNDAGGRTDLIRELLDRDGQLLVGGQQRLCTASICDMPSLPLPRGRTGGFAMSEQGGRKRWLVKWILLSPAIWPAIPAKSKDGQDRTPHDGGWLPNWISQADGQVLLRAGERQRRSYGGKHTRGFVEGSMSIAAKLVAAVVPKPVPVTGWAMANLADPVRGTEGGAKSTHLAVPAGAIYYFEADSEAAAQQLAASLNWHGSDLGFLTVKNRRSTLMGEKGFGLGVCGTWNFFENVKGRPTA